jgi:hypothetical protein
MTAGWSRDGLALHRLEGALDAREMDSLFRICRKLRESGEIFQGAEELGCGVRGDG